MVQWWVGADADSSQGFENYRAARRGRTFAAGPLDLVEAGFVNLV
jgi:hypothetical protein